MSKNEILAGFLFALSLALSAQEQLLDISNVGAFGTEKEIHTGDISVSAKIRGTPFACETYDIYAPFDGRIDEITVELFDLVHTETVMAKAVTKDMAAILDTANPSDPQSKKQILKRWKGTFDYYYIKPDNPGIVVNIYVKPNDYVNEGDKLFTVARKMQIIAVNTEPIYSRLAATMKASMYSLKDPQTNVNLYLKSFVPIKDRPFFYKLWMDIETLKSKIRVGETFEGSIFIGESKNAMLVDRKDLIVKNGKRYLLMEIKPGLISADKLEILSPTKSFLPAMNIPSDTNQLQPAAKNLKKEKEAVLPSKAQKSGAVKKKMPAKSLPQKEEYEPDQ